MNLINFYFLAAKALNKQANDDKADDTEEESDKENNTQSKEEGVKKVKKRVKKKKSTITKNKDTLNAKLETVPFTDPFFAKQNSIVGDINSSKRLMQNTIPTVRSCLKLHQNGLFWDSSNVAPLELVDVENIDFANLPDNIGITAITALNIHKEMHLHFHPTLKDYCMSDQIIEEDDTELSKFDNE